MVLFDYALLQYYSKSGLPVSDLMNRFDQKCSGLVRQILDISNQTCGGVVPHLSMLYFARDLYPEIAEIFDDRRLRQEFEQMEEMTARELYQALPVWFSQYINDAETKYVFIFDDYETMQSKVESRKSFSGGSDMVRRLFSHMNNTLFVISSREKIWNGDEEQDNMEQYLIDRLSPVDAELFLRSIPITDDGLIGDIIEVAQGLPLYLDLCVEMYVDCKNGGKKTLDFRKIDSRILVERYLGHLSENEIIAVNYMHPFELVDRNLMRFLFDAVHLTVDDYVLDHLLERSIFEQVGEGLYKLDATLQSHEIVHGALSAQAKKETAQTVLLYMRQLMARREFDGFRRIFCDACRLIHENAIILAGEDKDALVDAVHFMVDLGFWDYLEEVAERYFADGYYAPLYRYAKCQILKRHGSLEEALALCPDMLDEADWFENNEYCCSLLEVQIRHLLGDYEYAIGEYRNIMDDMELFNLQDKDSRTYTFCGLKYADQLLLRGEFSTAMKYLDSIDVKKCDSPDAETECLRIKGHIYKFNFDERRAKKIYAHALKKCSSDCKSRGSLLNNMAEITCVHAPEEAFHYGEESLKLNGAIGARIECGKTHCAMAIAHAFAGDFEASAASLKQAEETQREAGYKSGLLFAEFARLIVLLRNKQGAEMTDSCLQRIRDLSGEIGVYEFLEDIAEVLCGKKEAVSENYEWQNAESLVKACGEMEMLTHENMSVPGFIASLNRKREEFQG